MSSLSEVLQKHRAAKEVRLPHERQWWLNMAFVQNEQWVVWDRYSNSLRYKAMDAHKPKLTSNIITPRIRLQYSILTRAQPAFQLKSATQAAAKSTYYCMSGFWDRYKYLRTFKESLLWAICTGSGYVKPYWDPFAGPHYGNGCYGGAPMLDSVSPFELYADPFARTLDEASWVILVRVRSRGYVREKWGVDPGSVPVELMSSTIGSLRLRYNQALVPSTLVCEYWERPNAKNPHGYYLVYSGNTVLHESDNPYAFGEDGEEDCSIPLVSVRQFLNPGALYGTTWVSDTRQTNVVHNRVRNDALENTAKLSNPPLIMPKGALSGDYEGRPGEIMQYNGIMMQGGQVKQLEIVPYPPQAMNMLVRLEQEADQSAGLTALDWGNMPRGVRSKQQMGAIEGMADQRQQVTLDEYVAMVTGALDKVLRLTRKFMTLPREVYGGDTTYVLKGADIPPDTQVKVKVTLKEAPSDQDSQGYLFGLFDRHVIQDPRLLARLSRYGDFDEIFVDADLDTNQAQRENRKMAQGQPVQAEDYQNHAVHRIEHDRFRKSEEYDQMPDSIKQLFAQHDAEHQRFQAQAAQQQQGQPGQQGPPGQPGVHPPGRPPGAQHPGNGPPGKGAALHMKPPGAQPPPGLPPV